MDKNIVYIGLEFLFGPIQKFEENENGDLVTGIRVIDEDDIIQKLDYEINDLWCSLWTKDDNESSGMRFDKLREKALAPELIELITQLLNRLNEINDGTYEVEDMISDHLRSLID